MEIQNVMEEAFSEYGKVIGGYDLEGLIEKMQDTPLPDDVIYVPSIKELEELPVAKEFKNRMYGGLPIQLGYCNGNNHKLNAVEYHRSSEVNVAVTDMILLLGRQQDIKPDFTYDTSNIKAFLVPAGTAVEIYATTLHYAPCNVDATGFRCVVILPADTNTEITFPLETEGEDRLMTAKNKWLIAHEEAAIDGAYNGLIGENISL